MSGAAQAGGERPDIDALLQDTYLLVVELRNDATVTHAEQLRALCVAQVEALREALDRAGQGARCIRYITHAQCALLDETVLGCAAPQVRDDWAGQTLQAQFFNSHQAGESLYEDMRAVLREPAADPLVLTTFQRVLMLGFKGRYPEPDDPQRLQLLAELDARVAPLDLSAALLVQPGGSARRRWLRWLHSPALHLAGATLLVAGLWWWLDQQLAATVAALLPGRT